MKSPATKTRYKTFVLVVIVVATMAGLFWINLDHVRDTGSPRPLVDVSGF